MLGYKLKIPKSIPRAHWACKAWVERYSWQNNNKPNMIEFSVSNSDGRVFLDNNGGSQRIEGRHFNCLVGDGKWRSYAEDGITVEVLSVAISIDGLEYTEGELELEDAADEDCILLPRTVDDEDIDGIENLLYRIIEVHKENSAITNLACGTAALTLMVELDFLVRKSIRARKNRYIHYYVDKTEAIINGRYSERLTLKGVASELGISPNYLSAIFKAAKGMGFTDRLLEVRMRRAEALLAEGKLSVAENSSSLGYDEIGHFRRRFKQYFGISIRDYRCISRELTLYHPKPQRSESQE